MLQMRKPRLRKAHVSQSPDCSCAQPGVQVRGSGAPDPPVLPPGSFPGGPRSTGRALTLGQAVEPTGPLKASWGKEIPSSWPSASQQGCQLTPSADSNSAPVARQPAVFLAKPPPPDWGDFPSSACTLSGRDALPQHSRVENFIIKGKT